ncbi:MAG: ATPase [Gammaproteobacteria bacterium]|nr:MAG: ATPase [Gammaproteobacteria bacterium]
MQNLLDNTLQRLNQIILGKPEVVRQALVCLLARGHLLIEDLPGTGKTTLAHALAKVLGLAYQRVQFTSDLLPADIIGVSIFQQAQGEFRFHPGPLFKQLVLADEINRATPKTQSALLEAMEEQQVTVDGETHALPQPFFVIATQNPSTQIGTFPLPESQLDRFLMRISIGQLDQAAERALLLGEDRRQMLDDTAAELEPQDLLALQARCAAVQVAEPLVVYLQAILQHSRDSGLFEQGLSPRAGLGIKRAAQANALLLGRDYVTPEDVQAVVLPVANHRLLSHRHESLSEAQLREQLLEAVPVP